MREANWTPGSELIIAAGSTHGQAILEGGSLSFAANGRGRREASPQGTGGRETSTAAEALGKVQS